MQKNNMFGNSVLIQYNEYNTIQWIQYNEYNTINTRGEVTVSAVNIKSLLAFLLSQSWMEIQKKMKLYFLIANSRNTLK